MSDQLSFTGLGDKLRKAADDLFNGIDEWAEEVNRKLVVARDAVAKDEADRKAAEPETGVETHVLVQRLDNLAGDVSWSRPTPEQLDAVQAALDTVRDRIVAR